MSENSANILSYELLKKALIAELLNTREIIFITDLQTDIYFKWNKVIGKNDESKILNLKDIALLGTVSPLIAFRHN